VGHNPKVGHKALSSGSVQFLGKNLFYFSSLLKIRIINSGATTCICQILNGVHKSAYFHADFKIKF